MLAPSELMLAPSEVMLALSELMLAPSELMLARSELMLARSEPKLAPAKLPPARASPAGGSPLVDPLLHAAHLPARQVESSTCGTGSGLRPASRASQSLSSFSRSFRPARHVVVEEVVMALAQWLDIIQTACVVLALVGLIVQLNLAARTAKAAAYQSVVTQ